MNTLRAVKPSFTVIGKEGSTDEGKGFIQRLWSEANARFGDVAPLAKKNPDGTLAGIWGAMTDPTRAFHPWTDGFTKGLYLAGVEARDDAEPPVGWVKWRVPGYEYLIFPGDTADAFERGLACLAENGLTLVGAAHDFTEPATGRAYIFYPIRALADGE